MREIVSCIEALCAGMKVEVQEADDVAETALILSFAELSEAENFLKQNLSILHEKGITVLGEEMKQSEISAESIGRYFEEHGVLPKVEASFPVRVMDSTKFLIPDLPKILHSDTSEQLVGCLYELWSIEKFGYLHLAKNVIYGMFLADLSSSGLDRATALIAEVLREVFGRRTNLEEVRNSLVTSRQFYIGPM